MRSLPTLSHWKVILLALCLSSHAVAGEKNPRAYCRAILNVAFNAPMAAISAAKRKFGPKVSNYFQTETYWAERARLAQNPELLREPIDPRNAKTLEHLLAHLDEHVNSFQFPITTVQAITDHPKDAGRFLRALDKAIWRSEAPEKTIDRLTLLFYGISHAIPYETIETMLYTPNGLGREIVAMETERLVLKHSLAEVMNRFGLPYAARDASFRAKTIRTLRIAVTVPLKILGYTESATGAARLVMHPAFYDDVLNLGFHETMGKWRPKFEKVIGKKARFEVFVSLAGNVFGIYFTYRAADKILDHFKSKESVTETDPPPNFERAIRARGEMTEPTHYGEGSLTKADLAEIALFYRTFHLREDFWAEN